MISSTPQVKLINYFKEPYNNAIATARTCYSSKVIYPNDVKKNEKLRDRIGESIYKAGHHTVFQHAHFQFVLEKVSRQFIWSFLHSHPFYNSEQVSQRYVEVKENNFFIPPIEDKNKKIYIATINFQMQAYKKLIELLDIPVKNEYKKIFSKKTNDEFEKIVKKKKQEIARYVLPVATYAHLYHTVSGLTLYRYYRLCEQFDVPYEQKIVVKKMVEEVNKIDPLFFKHCESSIPLENTVEYEFLKQWKNASKEFYIDFDDDLKNLSSKLVDYKINCEKVMADSIRAMFNISKNEINDKEAIGIILDPKKNKYLTDTLNLTSLAKLTKVLVHPHFTFKKRISHCADSQNQRHRMTPATRPILSKVFNENNVEYITPTIIKENASIMEYYHEIMCKVWDGINKLLNNKVSHEFALYLLPNAYPIRFYESGSLLDFYHKWTKRLCFTAQEEIWRTSLEEVMQVKEKFPHIGYYIFPPCKIRRIAKVAPFCPEGERFCGIKVWELNLENYSRKI
jgi:flavin-dependent thymidylate synthase